jgi:ribosomal protein S27E
VNVWVECPNCRDFVIVFDNPNPNYYCRYCQVPMLNLQTYPREKQPPT